MKKIKKIKIIWLISFLFLAGMVLGEEGCYVFKESNLYCLNLEEGLAKEDCSKEGCSWEEAFFPEENCRNLDKFQECEEIFCRKTCDYEFLGKCLEGEVPPGEEYEWCSFGCCQFEAGGREFCSYKKNKWWCETEARQKGEDSFNFEAMEEMECQEICNKALILGSKLTESLGAGQEMAETAEAGITEGANEPEATKAKMKEAEADQVEVREAAAGIKEAESIGKTEEGKIPEESKLKTNKETETGELTGNLGLWAAAFLFFLAVVIYLLYQKPKVIMIKPDGSKERFFLIRRGIKKREKRTAKLKEERERKKEEAERAELFRLFELGEKATQKLNYTDLLGKIVKAHELRKTRKGIQEGEVFKKIDELAKKREREKSKRMTEEEARDVFEKLRRITFKAQKQREPKHL